MLEGGWFRSLFLERKFLKEKRILMNSNLVHLVVIGDFLNCDAFNLH